MLCIKEASRVRRMSGARPSTVSTPFLNNYITSVTYTAAEINTGNFLAIRPYTVGKYRVVVDDGRIMPPGELLPPYFEVKGGYNAQNPVRVDGVGNTNVGTVVESSDGQVVFDDLANRWEVLFDPTDGVMIRKESVPPVFAPVTFGINLWLPLRGIRMAYTLTYGLF